MNRWTRKHTRMLIEQLEMYVKAGLPASIALQALRSSVGVRNAKKLESISVAVESGRKLSAALQEYLSVPASILGLIACGEASGSFAVALAACKSLLERQDELIKKCLSAMAYPAVIGISTIALTIGLVKGTMPQIIPLLTGLHAKLPVLTRAVIAVSDIFTVYGLHVLGGMILVFLVVIVLYRFFARCRFIVHRLVMYAPVLGARVRSYNLVIFFQSFGSMIEAGISAVDAYAQSAGAIGLLPMRERFKQKLQPLIRGEPFALIAEAGMPAYIESLLRAGEVSGSLGSSAMKIAQLLDRELDHSLRQMTALLEPTMMVGMGGVVGSIALSIMMPIYDISKVLQK